MPILDKLAALRLHISEQSFIDEQQVVQKLLQHTQIIQARQAEIYERAAAMVQRMRKTMPSDGVEVFLQEYGLETKEGVAIMCLAEALLRIPDHATVDALIEDTFETTTWNNHIGNSESLLVNASSWGLLLTGKIVHLKGDNALGIFGKAIARLGEPVIRESLKAAMRLVGNQFVLGEDIVDAMKHGEAYLRQHYSISFDILGEGARTHQQAEAYTLAYMQALETFSHARHETSAGVYSISIKLSALHPRLHLHKRELLMKELMPRLKRIVLKAKEIDMRVSIDAEEASRLDVNLELFTALMMDADFEGWNGIGYVVQAYQKRAIYVIDYLRELAILTHHKIPVRLVKGAYWDSEIKWAQMSGLPDYPVFTKKEHTDVSYLACAEKLLAASDDIYPQFATHNALTASGIITLAEHHGISREGFEFQRLHGMGEALHRQLVADYHCRIYAPVGKHRDLLAYLIRRLMENSANSSFVHLLMDANTPMETLLSNPIDATMQQECTRANNIPLPKHLYGAWLNSSGNDTAYLAAYTHIQQQLQPYATHEWRFASPEETYELRKSPNDLHATVGSVHFTAPSAIEARMQEAMLAHAAWAKITVDARASMLEAAADLIAAHQAELLALLMREAGKHIYDAVAEIREAEDFCRYYASQSREIFKPDQRPGPTGESNVLHHHPRGIIVCISPWNFPLAIFIGQVAAALVTGNCVLAKPAEQTPLIAELAVRLMHEAGIPRDVLQLVQGAGDVGNALVKHKNISGVVFTGSFDTAKKIQHNLSESTGAIVPLIAETGGINCMVVDSSALLEQAVDDIMLSAFGSSGQRCSALRLLYVQEDIADNLLEMLTGAMACMQIGDTLNFANDIGAVIDEAAKARLEAHIEHLKQSARFIAAAPAPKADQHGYFVTPHAFELTDDADITEEFFGPVLHVIRFKQQEIFDLPARINARGFGLTFGIHSRIQQHIHHFTTHIHAGNIYVNRSMIGAVVGVQPFGGEGLSGTGPKAGGAEYLRRFTVERHVSINTSAIGGNINLLSH